jgi:hypothetical protein
VKADPEAVSAELIKPEFNTWRSFDPLIDKIHPEEKKHLAFGTCGRFLRKNDAHHIPKYQNGKS